MSHPTSTRVRRQVQAIRARFAQADGLPFANVLPAERLERALHEEGATWRKCLFTPTLTLWAFLTQAASATKSCTAAVARIAAYLTAQGEPPCGPDTSGYCKARARLPEGLLARLARETGSALHRGVPDRWRWHGRRVVIADGTTVSMPDTSASQAAYPQPTTQTPGVGFPQARLVALFSLACGAVLDAALGPCRGKLTGETALLRGIADSVEAGSVLLTDRYFGGWFDLALWRQRGVDVVTRLHQARHADFHRGRRLGPGDHVVRWPRPQRPAWLSQEEYRALPEELELREVRVRVEQAGFRTRGLVVVTTLTDPEVLASEWGELYRRRWQAELDLRSLKATLDMDVLRGQSPEMVRKEVWAHLLAYNLIRTTLAQAAEQGGCEPRELSFAAAVQTLEAFAGLLAEGRGYEAFLRQVLGHRVGDRPDRYEPRARKRRPKAFPPLTEPRQQARNRLAA